MANATWTDPEGTSPINAPSVDKTEIERFAALADRWWDPAGEFRPLHKLNPVRIAYIRDQLIAANSRDPSSTKPLAGLKLLDVGCGGGLIAEPMCRLGAAVTGIDAAERNVSVARRHGKDGGLNIDYVHTSAEDLAKQGKKFDVVLALEIIEHVADVDALVVACEALLRPGGILVLATLNRTFASYAMAIVAAEHILGWLPAGTHDWSRFVKPAELIGRFKRKGLSIISMTGVRYNPLADRWLLSQNFSVNYMMCAQKPTL